jgi:hypothetical protein
MANICKKCKVVILSRENDYCQDCSYGYDEDTSSIGDCFSPRQKKILINYIFLRRKVLVDLLKVGIILVGRICTKTNKKRKVR